MDGSLRQNLKMSKTVVLYVIAGLLIAPAAAYAGSAFEFSSASHDSSNGSWVFGVDFTVGSSDLLVSSLGYFDDNGDGFLSDHEVGIYDAGGNLLASTDVTNSDPLTGHFRFDAITPLTLLAGNSYIVVGVNGSDHYTYVDPGFVTDPDIIYHGAEYGNGNTLFDPSASHNNFNDGFWGPNFQVGVASASPEPATFSFMGMGLTVLFAVLRRGRTI
jgi:hypothetical protein